jgi:hypothetical protein
MKRIITGMFQWCPNVLGIGPRRGGGDSGVFVVRRVEGSGRQTPSLQPPHAMPVRSGVFSRQCVRLSTHGRPPVDARFDQLSVPQHVKRSSCATAISSDQ